MTLAEAVSKVLNGMPIHYYMAVDYEGVGNIVDAIGGVWYDVPFHMKYDDTTKGIEDLHIDIPAGRQHLDRENAVEFLRFRKTNDYYKRQGYHGYPDEDIGRIKAQQKFMEEAFRQALGPQLPKVVATVLENVESDLDGKTAFRLATKAASLTGDSVTGWTLPGEDHMKGGVSFYFLDEEGVEELLAKVYGQDLSAQGTGEVKNSGTTYETVDKGLQGNV